MMPTPKEMQDEKHSEMTVGIDEECHKIWWFKYPVRTGYKSEKDIRVVATGCMIPIFVAGYKNRGS